MRGLQSSLKCGKGGENVVESRCSNLSILVSQNVTELQRVIIELPLAGSENRSPIIDTDSR